MSKKTQQSIIENHEKRIQRLEMLVLKVRPKKRSKPPSYILNYDDLHFIELIARGGSGSVYKGTLTTDIDKDSTVAIKVLRNETQPRELTNFKYELKIIKSLKSPYIVTFIGATLKPKITLITEYCVGGTLFDILSDNVSTIKWDVFFGWIHDITKGLDYLHKNKIVHRDLKTLNILLDDKNLYL